MAIVTFDMGGTSVKYGLWESDQLSNKGSFKTPKTWEEMKQELLKVKETFEKESSIEGVAFSAPGAVNQKARQIEGASAIPYIHFFPIYDELEEAFGVPVSFENDANSAALAEVWKGAAKGKENVLFVVIGTGIGGAVIVNGEVQHGKHLHGGEFGFALLTNDQTFSQLASPVKVGRRYADRKGLSYEEIDGQEIFRLAEEENDAIAKEEVDSFYFYLAKGIYNLTYSFDPEVILLGGGVSNKPNLLQELDKQFDRILDVVGVASFKPELAICEFKNDANLIGAVKNFLQQQNQ
jgi:predicted NBD/HSP70 family sugar kinase